MNFDVVFSYEKKILEVFDGKDPGAFMCALGVATARHAFQTSSNPEETLQIFIEWLGQAPISDPLRAKEKL